MSLQVLKVGQEQTPVLVIDNFVQSPDDVVAQAAALAPFPPEDATSYPGLRRHITPQDGISFDYVQAVCRSLAPVMGQVFGLKTVELADASFSLVTTPPEGLHERQSRPHVDGYSGTEFAILHYLFRQPFGGTGFYRHTRTGFERLTAPRITAYEAARQEDAQAFGPAKGYFSGQTPDFTELTRIEARFNRALIYPGNLIHCGLIPPGFAFSSDPRLGRLTANILMRGTA